MHFVSVVPLWPHNCRNDLIFIFMYVAGHSTKWSMEDINALKDGMCFP